MGDAGPATPPPPGDACGGVGDGRGDGGMPLLCCLVDGDGGYRATPDGSLMLIYLVSINSSLSLPPSLMNAIYERMWGTSSTLAAAAYKKKNTKKLLPLASPAISGGPGFLGKAFLKKGIPAEAK